MNPNTMAQLCCKRLLTSDHLLYMIERINERQNSCHVVYGNYVKDVGEYLRRMKHSNLEKIVIMANVGNSGGSTFMGTEVKEGNHWSFLLYDNKTSETLYCDSLGWSAPTSLIEMMKCFTKHLFGVNTFSQEKTCHDPTSHQYNRLCSDSCYKNYPLQTCGNICGIVAILMTALVTLRPNYFNAIMSSSNYYFMRDPTKYSGYLRLVLCSWYENVDIEIENIIPANLSNLKSSFNQIESDVSVEEDVTIIDEIDNPLAKKPSSEAQEELLKNSNDRFACPGCSQTFTKKVY